MQIVEERGGQSGEVFFTNRRVVENSSPLVKPTLPLVVSASVSAAYIASFFTGPP